MRTRRPSHFHTAAQVLGLYLHCKWPVFFVFLSVQTIPDPVVIRGERGRVMCWGLKWGFLNWLRCCRCLCWGNVCVSVFVFTTWGMNLSTSSGWTQCLPRFSQAWRSAYQNWERASLVSLQNYYRVEPQPGFSFFLLFFLRSTVNCVTKRKYYCTLLADSWSVIISSMRVVHITVAYTALQCKEGKLLYNCQTLKCFQFTNVLAVWRFDSAEDVASFLRYSFYILKNNHLFCCRTAAVWVPKAEPSEPSRTQKD